MFLNNFSVRIPQGIEQSGGYVELEHKTQYTLVLTNARPTRCDAEVEIDGKRVGVWRLQQQSSISLERPAHDSGRFTFYKVDTIEGKKAGLDAFDSHTGLIKVTFTPEVETPPQPPVFALEAEVAENLVRGCSEPERHGLPQPTSPSKAYSPGGTGLSGRSSQSFQVAESIVHDDRQQTIIHLRLVARDVDEPRPLTPFSTPVPPPVSRG